MFRYFVFIDTIVENLLHSYKLKEVESESSETTKQNVLAHFRNAFFDSVVGERDFF